MGLQVTGQSLGIDKSAYYDTYILKENKPEKELFSNDIYVSAALYLSIFAHPPFNEECFVNDQRIEGLLSNPLITSRLLQLLNSKYSATVSEDSSEIWEIEAEDFIQLFEDFENDEFTKLLHEEIKHKREGPWVKDSYVESVNKVIKDLKQSENDKVSIRFAYPTQKVLASYKKDSQNQDSLVICAGRNITGTLVTKRVNANNVIQDELVYPTMVGRIRDMGETTESYLEIMKEEMGFYISEEQIQNVFNNMQLEVASKAVFLAEVAKIRGDKVADQAATMLTLEYLTQVVGEEINKLPKDLIFFTFEGTFTSKENFLRGIINVKVKEQYGVEYTEEQWQRIQLQDGRTFMVAKFHRE